MKPHLIHEMRLHHERCGLIPEVAEEHDENKINELKPLSDRKMGLCYTTTSVTLPW